jgi:hypothetical protein
LAAPRPRASAHQRDHILFFPAALWCSISRSRAAPIFRSCVRSHRLRDGRPRRSPSCFARFLQVISSLPRSNRETRLSICAPGPGSGVERRADPGY